MNQQKTLTFAAAALSGLLAGSAARAATIPSSTNSTQGNQLASAAGHRAIMLDDTTKHDCKGQNACKGQGGCSSGDGGCKGKNSCKGKGGCNTKGNV
jgi:hypothetical protein